MLRDCRFQSAKTKVWPIVTHTRQGKLNCLRVPFPRQPFDDWPTGIAEPEQLRDLVEGFAGGIIARPADDFIFSGPRHEKKIRVSA